MASLPTRFLSKYGVASLAYKNHRKPRLKKYLYVLIFSIFPLSNYGIVVGHGDRLQVHDGGQQTVQRQRRVFESATTGRREIGRGQSSRSVGEGQQDHGETERQAEDLLRDAVGGLDGERPKGDPVDRRAAVENQRSAAANRARVQTIGGRSQHAPEHFEHRRSGAQDGGNGKNRVRTPNAIRPNISKYRG